MNQLKFIRTIAVFTAILFSLSIVTSTPQQNSYAQSDDEKTGSDIKRITSTSNPDLNIISVSNYFNQDSFIIVGEVLNKAQEEKTFVKITGTFYDDTNTVIGTSFVFTDPTSIPPSETGPFKLTVYPDDVSNLDAIKSYKLMVSSN